MDLQVTSLQELKSIAEGEVVPLPRFKEDTPFNVRLKRVSMLNLIRTGVIPNKLLSAAQEMFYGKKSSTGEMDMEQSTKIMFTMAEAALVEPSIKQLSEMGLELTDEQLVSIFNFTQRGVSELEKFREKPKDNVSPDNGETVPSKTE